MMILQIEESKVNKLSDHIEQGLHHLGRAMSCVEQMLGDEKMHERGGYMGYREQGGRYGGGHMNNRYPIYGGYGMGYKDDEDWEEHEPMGERRRRDSRGRYM